MRFDQISVKHIHFEVKRQVKAHIYIYKYDNIDCKRVSLYMSVVGVSKLYVLCVVLVIGPKPRYQ